MNTTSTNTEPAWFRDLQQYGSSTVSSVSGVVYKPSLWVNTTNTAGTSWPIPAIVDNLITDSESAAYNTFKSVLEKGERTDEWTEQVLSRVPSVAVSYGACILNRRFIIAEHLILDSPFKQIYIYNNERRN